MELFFLNHSYTRYLMIKVKIFYLCFRAHDIEKIKIIIRIYVFICPNKYHPNYYIFFFALASTSSFMVNTANSLLCLTISQLVDDSSRFYHFGEMLLNLFSLEFGLVIKGITSICLITHFVILLLIMNTRG